MSEIAMSNRDKALKKELSTYMDLHYPERRTDYAVMLAQTQRMLQREDGPLTRLLVAAFVRRETRRAMRRIRRAAR